MAQHGHVAKEVSAPEVPAASPSFRKPTFVVHWPEEMAGADYQKLMAIEPGTSVRQLLDKMLGAPVAKARGPWDPSDWALWIEARVHRRLPHTDDASV